MRSPNFSTHRKLFAALSALCCLALPLAASAQQSPYDQQPPYPQQNPYEQQNPYGQQPQYPQQNPYGQNPYQQPYPQEPPPPNGPRPSYAQPPPTYAQQSGIRGTITGFDGQWIVYMHDDKGYIDHITLHQGTMINPTGIRLIEGMRATVYGYADGPTYQANRIDVAYSPYSPYYGYGGYPYYGYYPYGYGYGYPYYGWGWPYWGGWGIGIGVNWGWGWGWGWRGCCWGAWHPWGGGLRPAPVIRR
jgi:hypothetical protein